MRRDEDYEAEDLEATRRLLDEAAALPRSIEPEHDLWPQIAQRIRASRDFDEAAAAAPPRERAAGWRSPWARGLLAAAAVLVLFAVGYVTGVLQRPEVARVVAPVGRRTVATQVDWSAADAALAQLLTDRSEELDPETIALIRTNLEIIDTAVREIRAALEDDPGNPELERLLTAGYRRRGALLRRTANYAESI